MEERGPLVADDLGRPALFVLSYHRERERIGLRILPARIAACAAHEPA